MALCSSLEILFDPVTDDLSPGGGYLFIFACHRFADKRPRILIASAVLVYKCNDSIFFPFLAARPGPSEGDVLITARFCQLCLGRLDLIEDMILGNS